MNNMGGTTILVRFPQGVNLIRKLPICCLFQTFSWGYQHKLFREAFWMPLKDVFLRNNKSSATSVQSGESLDILVAGILILLMAVFNYVSMCVATSKLSCQRNGIPPVAGLPHGVSSGVCWESRPCLPQEPSAGFCWLRLWNRRPVTGKTRLDIWGRLKRHHFANLFDRHCLVFPLLAGVVPAVLLSPPSAGCGERHFPSETKAVYLRHRMVQSGLTVAMLTCTPSVRTNLPDSA